MYIVQTHTAIVNYLVFCGASIPMNQSLEQLFILVGFLSVAVCFLTDVNPSSNEAGVKKFPKYV